MPIPLIPIVAIAGAVATAVGVIIDSLPRATRPRFVRELQGGETRAIASLTPRQIARVVGTIAATGELATSPMSERPCVAWEVSVWQPIGLHAWRKVGAASGHVPFSIEDASGRAAVRADNVESYGVVDHEKRFPRADAELRALLGNLSLREAVDPAQPVHLKESVLCVGERAVVAGQVQHAIVDDGGGGYRERTGTVEVVLTAPREGAVLFSDAPEVIAPKEPEAVP